MSPTDTAIRDLLPLRPVVFAVLSTLVPQKRSGYEILEAVNQQAGGRRIFGPGTLYRVLKEMRENGLIEHTAPPASGAPDERKQFYRCTALGRRAARAEAERLSALIRSVELGRSPTPRRSS